MVMTRRDTMRWLRGAGEGMAVEGVAKAREGTSRLAVTDRGAERHRDPRCAGSGEDLPLLRLVRTVLREPLTGQVAAAGRNVDERALLPCTLVPQAAGRPHATNRAMEPHTASSRAVNRSVVASE